MRIQAIVFTTNDDPGVPRLEVAWDARVTDADSHGLDEDFASVLRAHRTHRTVIVTIEVPDSVLLDRLCAQPSTVPGRVI